MGEAIGTGGLRTGTEGHSPYHLAGAVQGDLRLRHSGSASRSRGELGVLSGAGEQGEVVDSIVGDNGLAVTAIAATAKQ